MIIYGIELSEGVYEEYYTDIKKAFKLKEEAEKYVLKYNTLLLKLKEFYTSKFNHFIELGYENTSVEEVIFCNRYWKYEERCPCRIKEIELI